MRVMQLSATRVRLRYAAVAGMIVVLAVLWMTMRPVNETPQLVRVVPTERLSAAEEFAWESPFQAARYRVTLRDSNNGLIFTGEVRQSPFLSDRALQSQLRPGQRYSWKVESLDATGTVIAQSVPVTFVYKP